MGAAVIVLLAALFIVVEGSFPLYGSRDSFLKPTWETITTHNFTNEAVEVDGKRFVDCRFHNAKLVFHGKGPTEFLGNTVFGGTMELATDDLATMHYLNIESKLTSLPAAEHKRSAVDSKGNTVPHALDLTAKALENPVGDSKSLGNLPVYRQELEVQLLNVIVGTAIATNATVFVRLKLWAKTDLKIVSASVRVTTNGRSFETSGLPDLSGWLLASGRSS